MLGGFKFQYRGDPVVVQVKKLKIKFRETKSEELETLKCFSI